MKWDFLLYLAVISLCPSCGIREIGGEVESSGAGGVWGKAPGVQNSTGSLKSVFYMTVVEYQREYDWRSDQACESVKCSLVVYDEGVPVMKVPVGQMYQTSADPDMHRIIDGNLYTDYSTDSETVIMKNGVQLFTYQGREALYGMDIIDGDVYTLGQSRDGCGFAFRRNGELIMKREEGNLIGGLVNDDDSLCFAYYEQVRNAEGAVGRYYRAVNGDVFQVAVREDIRTVWDILVSNKDAVYLASLVGVSAPVIFKGESMRSLQMPSESTMISCRLFKLNEKVAVEGTYRMPDGRMYSQVWIDGRMIPKFPQEKAISALGVCEEAVFCAMNPLHPGEHGTIYRCGEIYKMPSGYSVIGSSMSMIDGILHMGLSSMDGQKPLLWKDGQTDSLDVNGYIASIYAEPQISPPM